MKDNFSSAPDQYAKYRPAYPAALFRWLKDSLLETGTAWDCATGNGQVASELACFCKEVYATDISQPQLDHAVRKDTIFYSVQRAEKTNFPDDFFDLITIAQAIHWFDFDAFYREAKRVAKPSALLVVIGYGNLKINAEIDAIIEHLYQHITGPYWDPERRYIDENYATIPFLTDEIACPAFSNSYDWSLEHLMGYLRTWSGVKHYTKKTGIDPVDLISDALKTAWGDVVHRNVRFPLLLRVAKIK